MNAPTNRDKLRVLEKRILVHLDRVGYSSPIVLQVRFSLSRQAIQRSLDLLYTASFIDRPMNGLAVSLTWKQKNPTQAKELESLLKTHIA